MAGNAQRIAVAVGIAAAFLLSGSSPALADHPLEPDLQTTPLGDADLEVYKPTKSRTLLGITNEVGNAGAGPLEITPSPVTPECVDPSTPHDEYTASQTIYEDSEPLNGYFERGVDTSLTQSEIGCLVFHDHPRHNHWHVVDFSKYSLQREKTGEVAESHKVGFCLLDVSNPFEVEPPGTAGRYFMGGCGFGDSSAPPGIMGISVGWADIYTFSTPGQQIRVDGLPKGRYCLRSEADPADNIIETNDENNAAETRIRLNPGQLRVTELSGPCSPPTTP